MNQNSRQSLVTLKDFKPALEAMLETDSPYCLVGGLAVGQWAETLLSPQVRSQFELPIRSKDIDIRAVRGEAIVFVKNLMETGASAGTIIKRIPKDPTKSFPSIAVTVTLPDKGDGRKDTTVEALSAMPLLDEIHPDGRLIHHGTHMRYGKIYLLDPCSLLICKLNAIHTRPPGESDNDRKHATILSLVIPRFIEKTLARHANRKDPYHPEADATRLVSFLNREPWAELMPCDEKNRIVKACELAKADWEIGLNP